MNQKIRITLLAFWLGLMAFFSFVVAPAAFTVLPTQHLAGQVVSRTLGIAEILGIVLGVMLVLLLLFARGRKGRAFLFELIVVTLMTIAMVVSKVISGWMHALRLQTGETLYSLSGNDPVRSSFDQLHRASVGLTGFAMLAALVLLVMLVRRKDNPHGDA